MFRRVCWHTGVIQVEWSPGALRVLRKHGQPISEDASYVPRQFCTSFPVFLLEVAHTSGEVETWFFSEDLDYLADHVSRLLPTERERLKPFARHSLGLLWSGLIEGKALSNSVGFQHIMGLHSSSRLQLLSIADVDDRCEVIYCYSDELLAQRSSFLPGAMGRLIKFLPKSLGEILNLDMINLAREACSTGLLSIVSPFSGFPSTTDVSICATEIIYWYRFYDKHEDLMFYCIASLHHCRIVALFLPSINLFIIKEPLYRNMLEAMFAGSLQFTMFRHLCVYANNILPYLELPARSMTLLYGEEHFGHHFWNELTGLHAFLEEPLPVTIPTTIEMSSNSEMFGKLDLLFPELAGKVVRHTDRREALLIKFYQDGLCILRPTALTIRHSLRLRLATFVEQQCYIDAERVKLSGFRRDTLPIIAIAMRTENRTLVDPVGFYTKCIAHIVARLGPVCVVLDGSVRTMQGDATIRSTNADAAVSKPLLVELAVSQEMAVAFAALGCPVICNVDLPMGVNLFWLTQSSFFIGPWGAGLTRTRWVTNRPGIMLSNSANLNHHDINLYSSAAINEDSAPMIVVDADWITDRPDVALLVPSAPGFGTNFEIDFDAFAPSLDKMLDQCFPDTVSAM